MGLIPAKQLDGWGTPIETGEIVPQPEGIFGAAQSTLALAATYVGGSMRLHRAAKMSRLIFSMTAVTVNCAPRVLIYQTADGGSGVASKKASAGATLAAGAQVVTLTFEQGTVQFAPGLIYVLIGRTTGVAGTMQSYPGSSFALLNASVDANTHPLTYTTAISAAAADPNTFNPLTAAVSAITATTPICRLRA